MLVLTVPLSALILLIVALAVSHCPSTTALFHRPFLCAALVCVYWTLQALVRVRVRVRVMVRFRVIMRSHAGLIIRY